MTVSKLKGTNAVFIAKEAIEKIEAARDALNKAGVGFVITRNYGERANEAVNELVHHLEITIFIIMLILIPFLGWRESMVVTVAVPMILATTLFIAQLTDQTINRITLFAFLVSLFVAYVFAPYLARKWLNFKKIKKEVLAHKHHHAENENKGEGE